MNWHDLMNTIQKNIHAQEDIETLMQVYQKLNYLATEAQVKAMKLQRSSK